jgi:hypothetical protein
MIYDARLFWTSVTTFQKTAMAYGQMWVAANEVIWRRCMDMSLGTMTAVEASRMFYEKPVAFARAAEKAAMASALQKGHAGIALAAIGPISTAARSNARRLRSRKPKR